jgi:ABC-type methionine transport system ATPase subunit
VDGVSFRLARGEALVLVGPSGSGKSTLLRALNRLVEPTSGALRFAGRDVRAIDPCELRRRVALVMQTPVMFEGTVEENLRARPKGTAGDFSERRLSEVVVEVGLEAAVLGRDAASLSGGEKQRVTIARALLRDPDVFLLDEPTSALDPPNAALVVDAVARLREQRGLTIVAVTHQPELVRRIGGRLLYLVKGRVRADEPINGGAAFTSATLEAFLRGERTRISDNPEPA